MLLELRFGFQTAIMIAWFYCDSGEVFITFQELHTYDNAKLQTVWGFYHCGD